MTAAPPAVAAFEEARTRAKSPEWTAARDLYKIGLCYLSAGNPQQAAAMLEQSTRLNRWDTDGWVNRGIAYERLHQYDQEVTCCQQTLLLSPTDPDALYNLAGAYMYLKMYKAAIPLFQQILQGNPMDFQAQNNLAVCYQELNESANFQQAKARLDALLKGKVMVIKNPDESTASLLDHYGIHLSPPPAQPTSHSHHKRVRPSKDPKKHADSAPRQQSDKKPQFESKHHKKRRDLE